MFTMNPQAAGEAIRTGGLTTAQKRQLALSCMANFRKEFDKFSAEAPGLFASEDFEGKGEILRESLNYLYVAYYAFYDSDFLRTNCRVLMDRAEDLLGIADKFRDLEKFTQKERS